jgi:peroxiredoxin
MSPAVNLVTGEPMARTQQGDAAYEDGMEKGRNFMRAHKYEDALKSFKRANEMAGKKSSECLLGMAQAYQGLEAHKNVIETCEKLIELAGSDIQLRALAYNMKGIALQAQSEGKDQKKLRDAESAFRQSVAMNSDLSIVHYNLGLTLMQQGRDAEGIAEMRNYVALQPRGTKFDEARKLIENPRRARENYAPDFSITTSEGEYISLEDLRGKVVLLDFWATWCPPCVASTPAFRSLHKRFQKEPSFVMIAISSDREVEKWREFIAKNQMVWPQYRDRDFKVQRAFEVRSFPTYIVIDHEGIVRFRTSGFGSSGTVSIEEAISKALKMKSKSSASN